MNKHLIVIGIVIILLAVGLSGCTEESTEAIDTDGDGYGDNSDDYPTDANLHERIEIKSGTCYLNGVWSWELHGNRPGWGSYEYDCILGVEGSFYVDSDTKYVICEMSVQKIQNGQPGEYVTYFKTIETEHTSYTESINFVVNNPSTNQQESYVYSPGNDIRFPITEYNWGKWSGIAFSYESIDYDALVTFDIYMTK